MADYSEHVAQACAYLNDAGLPNVHTLTRHVAELVRMLEAIDRGGFNGSGIVANDPRVTAARAAVESVRPHLVSGI